MLYNKIMEFPKHPTKRQRQRQRDIAAVISGMQDILLEPSAERLDKILETAYDLPSATAPLGYSALRLIDINEI